MTNASHYLISERMYKLILMEDVIATVYATLRSIKPLVLLPGVDDRVNVHFVALNKI